MYTLDTNTVIYYAAGDKNVAAFLLEQWHHAFYLPSIVITEFLSYPLIDTRAIIAFRLFAQQTTIVNLDFQVAELSAEIRKNYHLKLADSVVAATALFTKSTLLTRNVRDFKKVTNLSLRRI